MKTGIHTATERNRSEPLIVTATNSCCWTASSGQQLIVWLLLIGLYVLFQDEYSSVCHWLFRATYQNDAQIRGMILKFWSWRDISVTRNATCLKIVPNNNIFFVYTPLWQVLCNLKERPENYPKTAVPSMHWPIRLTVHKRDLTI